MTEEIDIFIHPDGRVEIQVCGVKGEKCLEVTKAVEEALGGKVDREATSEMYEQATENVQDTRKIGY